ncbi:hypothetical protein D9758_013623 [Tetrapyrgos nigripes]|uniref:Annexin n=1 Tax=Tetrapyrgos nigripes TaxID=182062 RepID=A0A8H5CPW6_9AGAR|nr:hypothetical protein D9758_013623 [Tetrapyrgos nigripes]
MSYYPPPQQGYATTRTRITGIIHLIPRIKDTMVSTTRCMNKARLSSSNRSVAPPSGPPPGAPPTPSYSTYPGAPSPGQQPYAPPPGPPPQHGSHAGFQAGYNPSYTSPPPPPPPPGGGGWAPPSGPPPPGPPYGMYPPPSNTPYGSAPPPTLQTPTTSVITYLNAPVPNPWIFGPGGAPTPPNLVPGYDATGDVEKIRKATKGFGTDEAALVVTIAHLSSLQIASLGAVFKARTGKELVEVLDKETSSWFRATLHGLVLGPLWYDVELVSQAISGAGTDEMLLTELLVSRSSTDLQALSFAYHKRYGKDLQREVRVYTMLLSSTRPPDNVPVDHQAIERDVERLYKAGQAKLGTDEIAFCDILINRSTPQLIAIVDLYGRKYKSLAKVIKSEFSGHMRTTLLHIVHAVKSKHLSEGVGAWRDAKLLEASMKGLGTKDKQLVWRIVRFHWDQQHFAAIKAAYHKKYKKSLESRVAGETSGDYKKLLVALVKGQVSLV